MKMQWESARKVDASDCANKSKRIFQLNSIRVSERETEFLSVSLNTKTVAWMKMAFNGGCDTDGPHNKRLCTGQNIVSVNDNNNNTNGGALLSNGTVSGDVDMKGLGLLRVNFNDILNIKFHTIKKLMRKSDWNSTSKQTFPTLPPISVFLPAPKRHFRVKLNLIAFSFMTCYRLIFVITWKR